jgi:cobalt-zinc-cadmium efflux system protein
MHTHGHAHGRTSRVLAISIAATLAYIVLTVVAGIRAQSLALISEAGHNASDLFALVLSWLAVYFQQRPADDQRTYGYTRAGVLAAFLNALSLIVVSGYIFVEAVHRFRAPYTVQPRLMLIVAAIGVFMNGFIALALWRGGSDVNIRTALIHQLGDVASTAAVFAGAIGIAYTGLDWIDPLLSVLIGVLIVWSSVAIIRETLNILLEGTPHGVKLSDIAAAIRDRAGVIDVHDLHVWSIGSEVRALSCHIAIADIPPSESESILRDVQRCLHDRFHIDHTTIQFENAVCDVAHGCVIPVHDHQHEHSH